MSAAPLLAYFGHHKSASRWIVSVTQGICDRTGLKHTRILDDEMTGGDLGAYVRNKKPDFISYMNAKIRQVQGLEDVRGFHVVRDPRDIAVSAYFSHRYSHNTARKLEIAGMRSQLEETSPEEGLLLEMDFLQNVFDDMYRWDYDQPNVLELKMEDLTAKPYETFVEIFSFLGLTDEEIPPEGDVKDLLAAKLHLRRAPRRLPVDQVLGVVYRNRFSVKAEGREHGVENVKSHYRKGVAGDWVNHFNAEHVAYFKQRYNDLLVKLGYEADAGW